MQRWESFRVTAMDSSFKKKKKNDRCTAGIGVPNAVSLADNSVVNSLIKTQYCPMRLTKILWGLSSESFLWGFFPLN